MSYEQRILTRCDHCSDFEWGRKRDWFVGHRNDDLGKAPVHLCPYCSTQVWYCHDCEDFHPKDQDCPGNLPERSDHP